MPVSLSSKLLVLFVLASFGLRSQDSTAISAAINETFEKPDLLTKRKVTYLFSGKNAFVKYNPVSLFFGGLLMFYQRGISHLIGAACPYEVNCSDFSRRCIHRYGLLKGIPLTADRLTRCTRLALIDLVPGTDYSPKRNKIFDHPDDYSRKQP